MRDGELMTDASEALTLRVTVIADHRRDDDFA
jgi:hypothetical protein